MENRFKQSTITSEDFEKIKTPEKLVEVFAKLDPDNLASLQIALSGFQDWYQMNYNNRHRDIRYLTKNNFCKEICYALTTEDIGKLDPERLEKSIEKRAEEVIEDIINKSQDSNLLKNSLQKLFRNLLEIAKLLTIIKEGNSRKEQIIDQLRKIDLTGFVNLKGLDFSGMKFIFRPDLSKLYMAGANLSGSEFRYIAMTQNNLTMANLSLCKFINGDLINARLNGANLSGSDLTGTKLYSADLTDANLSNVNLTNADLTNAKLINTNLCGVILDNTNLDGVVFFWSRAI